MLTNNGPGYGPHTPNCSKGIFLSGGLSNHFLMEVCLTKPWNGSRGRALSKSMRYRVFDFAAKEPWIWESRGIWGVDKYHLIILQSYTIYMPYWLPSTNFTIILPAWNFLTVAFAGFLLSSLAHHLRPFSQKSDIPLRRCATFCTSMHVIQL